MTFKILTSRLLLACLLCCCLGCGVPPTEIPPQNQAEESPEPVANTAAEMPPELPAEPSPKSVEPEPENSAVTGDSTAEPTNPPEPQPEPEPIEGEFVEPPKLPPPAGATAMPEPDRVWVDTEKKIVFVDGYISLNEGMLEMFACPIGTKEHESIVAVYSSAQVVHAALLAVGAKVGSPVQFDPEFKPPTGTEIAIEVRWQDSEGQWQAIEAQQLITDIKTEQPMTHPWVFAGSGFYKDPESGEQFYMAEGGDFICVSNFSTATLDIPAESSQVNEGLMFEANPATVPPLWSAVRLVLTPKLIADR